mmetsp:Transcript_22424/g.32700  ORF Transcript_22424/g.32700 Transcript_22424/m.32700 type:complete len:321 (+) Transcript_22424:92-1054(+)|eukprot:CAMPEP_0185023772 /NCGR_PEP_ID=MMETSP1103-20130426/6397_1 /TAXON_ID=36769 /ORGANISM="Paraphysomonas bandaiensis, Strain Caron Lab Isolate" /LENGTH=320 /DNA_ID=CAMNT_0027556513 /DNA_START=105 /DNA_END=1067 /DNA_ORIENTATION=+
MGCSNSKSDTVVKEWSAGSKTSPQKPTHINGKRPLGLSVASSPKTELNDIHVNIPDPFRSHYKVTDVMFEKGRRKLCRGVNRTRHDVVIEFTNLKAYEAEGYTEIDFFNRLDILRELDHVCTPRVLDFFDGSDVNKIVFEYAPGKDLRHLLKAKGPLAPKAVKPVALALISVLQYLHKNNIIHRNLSASNIIMSSFSSFSNENQMKVVGFTRPARAPRVGDNIDGLSPLPPVEQKYIDSSSAPELCMAGHGPAVDLYSLGAVLYEAVTGTLPDSGDFTFGLEWCAEELVTYGVKELVSGLLSKDPLQRPNLKVAKRYFYS